MAFPMFRIEPPKAGSPLASHDASQRPALWRNSFDDGIMLDSTSERMTETHQHQPHFTLPSRRLVASLHPSGVLEGRVCQ